MVLAVSAAVVGCKKREPLPAPQAPVATVRAQIAWFKGDVDAAFAKASAEKKTVFLYWGAEWCPYCKDLKANVFSRRDFVEKSKLFVSVYLDGDDAGAQKWGDKFGIAGYPTVIVLRGDRTELARIGGGMDRNQYAEVLDLVLGDAQPVNQLLAAAERGRAPLSADACRRLAFNAWALDDATMQDMPRLASELTKAVDLCPTDARIERARLTVIAASATTGEPFSERLKGVQSILADRSLATSVGDAWHYLGADFFTAAKKAQPENVARLSQNWNEVMDLLAADERYTPGDRLAALNGKLVAAKALDPNGTIPPALAQQAKQRVDAALAAKYDEDTRAGVVNAALNTLSTLDDKLRAYEVAEAEMKVSKTPYYYMSDLATLNEEMGRKDAALQWFERAYRESKGAATRFQWGASYLNALIRMAPQDETRIRQAALDVLGELDGPDRLYERTRTRLEKLDTNLRKWNEAGAHAGTVTAIRQRMDDICAKIPVDDAAREACNGFLAEA